VSPALHSSGPVRATFPLPPGFEYTKMESTYKYDLRQVSEPCSHCGAPVGYRCATSGGKVAGTHAIRMAAIGERERKELEANPPPPPVNMYAQKAAARRMHLRDQTIVGPYYATHDPDHGVFNVYGHKDRTNGRVTLATFRYRANDEMYWPTYQQSGMVADILAARLNELHITLKDPRYDTR
jgi:hypothetical protein